MYTHIRTIIHAYCNWRVYDLNITLLNEDFSRLDAQALNLLFSDGLATSKLFDLPSAGDDESILLWSLSAHAHTRLGRTACWSDDNPQSAHLTSTASRLGPTVPVQRARTVSDVHPPPHGGPRRTIPYFLSSIGAVPHLHTFALRPHTLLVWSASSLARRGRTFSWVQSTVPAVIDKGGRGAT